VRVLVTGGDGFVGTSLVRGLRGAGHEVEALVFGRDAGPGERRLDLTRAGSLAALSGASYDAIIHTAGIVDQDAPARVHFAINAEGTRNVLAAAPALGCRHFIQISSIAVYGLRAMGEGRDEARTPRLRGLGGLPYMRSKARAEVHVERSGVPYTMLRLPSVIGAGDSFVSAALVPRLEGGALDRIGRRDRRFSTFFVENLAPIVDRLLAVGPRGRAYNCCDPDTTWGAFVDAHADALGVEHRPRARSHGAILRHLGDKHALFVLTGSAFGAHFPGDALRRELALPALRPWQEGVREGVAAFLARRAGDLARGT